MTDQPTTLMESTYRDLKARIIRLDMKPGFAFSENDIASSLGLSKTPVREALARLQLEGWVSIVPRSGYFVAPITLKDARDSLAVAVLLEAEVAGLAARLGADVAPLTAIDKRAATAARKRDVATFVRHRHEVVVGVAERSGNHRLRLVVDQIHDLVDRLTHVAASIVPAIELDGFGPVLDAIDAADGEAAGSVARERAGSRQRAILDALLASDAIMSANVTPRVGRASGGA